MHTKHEMTPSRVVSRHRHQYSLGEALVVRVGDEPRLLQLHKPLPAERTGGAQSAALQLRVALTQQHLAGW